MGYRFNPLTGGFDFTENVVKSNPLLKWLPKRLNRAPVVMASPPTLTTSTTGTQIASGQRIAIERSGVSTFPYTTESQFSISASAGAQAFLPVTVDSAGAQFQNQTYRYSLNFDGTEIEFENRSAGGTYWLLVNGEYVSLDGTQLAADSITRHIKLTFAARTTCRIDWVSYRLSLNNIFVDPTASVTPATVRGPRVIMQGDSFLANDLNSTRLLGDYLEWDDIWGSAVGGTGIINDNAGTRQSFEQRFNRDVIGFSPNIAWIVGSVNDDGLPPVDVAAAVLRMRNAFIAAKPDGIFIWSPNASNGPGLWTINKNRIRWAITSALAGLANTYVVDILERPLQTFSTLPTSTLRSAANIGATTLNCWGTSLTGGIPPVGVNLRIDDEIFSVRNAVFAGSVSGRYHYTITIDGAVKQAHAAEATWTLVGASYITGIGSVGSPAGWGSSDLYRTSASDLHPTRAGQDAIAAALATGIMVAGTL